jgi:hypothetical protein
VFAVALAALLLIGCGGGNAPQPQTKAPVPTPPATEVSFSKDVQPILNASCMPCHAGADAKAKYDLTGYVGVMGAGKDAVPNVLTGKCDSSLLFQMVSAGKMPPTGRLDSIKVATIKKWIEGGAKND